MTSPSTFLNDRGRLIPKLLGDHIEQEAHIRLGVDGRLWRYVNGCYRPDGEAHARAMTRRLLGREVRAQHQVVPKRRITNISSGAISVVQLSGSDSSRPMTG